MINKGSLIQRNFLMMALVTVFVIAVGSVSIAILVIYYNHQGKETPDQRMNVLFIVVDDLRPALGCYGDSIAITPNINQLASKSILFTNAYAQQAICAPSRTSFLTGRRPDTLRLYDNTGHYFRQAVWNFTTLPEHFKHNGYETVSVGKIFHHGEVSNKTDDYPYSWSREPYHPYTQQYKMAEVCPTPYGKKMNLLCPVDLKEQPGGTLPDIEVADFASAYIRSKVDGNHSQPFFLGVGFYKPHIPLKFPKEYLDLYPIEDMDLAPHNTKPEHMPDVAWNPWEDLRLRDDVKKLNLEFPYESPQDHFQKLIRQGYYASISYMDDQLGKILKALDETGFASNTTIVFIGDHGWSLGEHGEWSKYSNFDIALKVPLIVYVPGLTDKSEPASFHYRSSLTRNVSQSSSHHTVNVSHSSSHLTYKARYVANELVELVDLFPSLSEIANIAVPSLCPLNSNITTFCAEGVSFYPVIINHIIPSVDFSWKTAIFSQYPRPSNTPQENSDQPKLDDIRIMGYTMRNEYFRYTRWVRFNSKDYLPHWGTFEAHELYDKKDDDLEVNNLSGDPDYSNTINMLFQDLKDGWREALPYAIFGVTYLSEKYHEMVQMLSHSVLGNLAT